VAKPPTKVKGLGFSPLKQREKPVSAASKIKRKPPKK